MKIESLNLTNIQLFDEYKEKRYPNDTSEPIRHCILIANSLPYSVGVRYNVSEKFDNYTLSEIGNEMAKVWQWHDSEITDV